MKIRATDGFGTADRVVRPCEVVDLPDADALSVLCAGKAEACDPREVQRARDRENRRIVGVLGRPSPWSNYWQR